MAQSKNTTNSGGSSGKTIHSIRLNNLRILVEEFGTQRAIADASKTSETYLSSLLGNAPSYAERGVGSALARKLEVGCKKPVGWMDVDHSEDARDPREEELMSIFGKLSKAKKDNLLELAREIKGRKKS